MLKFVIALIAFGAVVVKAQDIVDNCIVCQQQNEGNDECVALEDPSALTQVCPTSVGSCFSRINENGFIERGCGSQLGNNTCDGETCGVCQLTQPASDACNNLRFPDSRLSCYVCDGDANSTCANLDRVGSTEHARLCPVFRSDDSCFSTRAGGNVTRGCASSMARGRCDHGVCGFCRGSNCNSGEFSSLNGAFTVQTSLKVLAIAIAFLALINK